MAFRAIRSDVDPLCAVYVETDDEAGDEENGEMADLTSLEWSVLSSLDHMYAAPWLEHITSIQGDLDHANEANSVPGKSMQCSSMADSLSQQNTCQGEESLVCGGVSCLFPS